ncbi:MAG TPA: J domain-containing protein [Polyangiaceae bacterium]|nr:J domain-containing protein [Polyangiaceae bacterium]
MTQLFAPVCSVTPTRRRRFLWAAWWSGPPGREPFRPPDAANGGARTREEAHQQAERACGAPLVAIDGSWARAWARVLRGEAAFPAGADARVGGEAHATAPNDAARANPRSVWETLGVPPSASEEEVKRAYRQRALETHPDRGGDAEAFRAVQRAYEVASGRKAKAARRPKRRREPAG